MRTFLSISLLLIGGSSFAATPDCGKAELNNYLIAISQFENGVMTRTDVETARLANTQAAFDCKLIEKLQFCYEAPESADAILAGIEQGVNSGQRSEGDVVAAQAVVTKLTNFCAPQ